MRSLLIALFFAQSCVAQKQVFQDKVLEFLDDRYCYFLSINITSPKFKGTAIIENDEMFYFLNRTQNMNQMQYVNKMRHLLSNKDTLVVGNIDLEKWEFKTVIKDSIVISNARKGKSKFIDIYFHNNVLKNGVTDNERTLIIDQLFKWDIATKIDCETGYLVLHR